MKFNETKEDVSMSSSKKLCEMFVYDEISGKSSYRKVYHVYFMDQNQSTRQKEPLNLRISYLPVNNKIQMRFVCCVGHMAGECFVV